MSTPHDAAKVNPTVPGEYNVFFERMRTFLPLFFEWDGSKWLGRPSHYDEAMVGKMFWYDNKETK